MLQEIVLYAHFILYNYSVDVVTCSVALLEQKIGLGGPRGSLPGGFFDVKEQPRQEFCNIIVPFPVS